MMIFININNNIVVFQTAMIRWWWLLMMMMAADDSIQSVTWRDQWWYVDRHSRYSGGIPSANGDYCWLSRYWSNSGEKSLAGIQYCVKPHICSSSSLLSLSLESWWHSCDAWQWRQRLLAPAAFWQTFSNNNIQPSNMALNISGIVLNIRWRRRSGGAGWWSVVVIVSIIDYDGSQPFIVQ